MEVPDAGVANSFITFRNVLSDNQCASEDMNGYLAELERKRRILGELILNANDGKSKAVYCLAVNLLPLAELDAMMAFLSELLSAESLSSKEKTGAVFKTAERKGGSPSD